MTALLSKVNERIAEIQKKMSPKLKDKPIFVGELSEKQWAQIEQLNQQFQEEYVLRREMLLKRLDVTVQSFHVRSKRNTHLTLNYFYFDHCSVIVLKRTEN